MTDRCTDDDAGGRNASDDLHDDDDRINTEATAETANVEDRKYDAYPYYLRLKSSTKVKTPD